ncbi:MAG TPA: DUF1638 domain-containing protein [Trebonia sp.]|nr:DUF1638 domain-containing protein [Trebonia sp.]
MSNSPTAPTSTTASSTNSGSVEVIACGALAGHIREIAARRGWPLVVRPLPASLHNRPEKIPEYSERARSSAPTVMAYADCGTYGKLDEFCAANDIPRLPGLHCYDLFAGPEVIAKLFEEEPGTYLLTDYLVRTFDRTVLASLGLDKHPDLWPDYFAHYTRLIWLAQEPTPELEAEATRIATLFALPLTTIPTGVTGLESALAALLADIGPVAHEANRSDPVAHRANTSARVDPTAAKADEK